MNQGSKKLFQILLIEDDIDLADWMIDCLQNQPIKMNIYHAKNGDMAQNYLFPKDKSPTALPHLILLDLHLPKQNGFDILKHIRSHPELSKIPVVVLSGLQSDQDMQMAYELHANSYLVKPLDSGKFETLLKLVCQYWLLWNHVPPSQNASG